MKRPNIAAIVNRSVLYWLLLPCLLVVALVGVTSAFWMRGQLMDSTNFAVGILGRHVQAYVDDAANDLGLFAQKNEHSAPDEIERRMGDFVNVSISFTRLIIVGADGQILHSVPHGTKGNDFPLELSVQGTGSLILSRPFLSPATGQMIIYLGHRTSSGLLFAGELNLSSPQSHIQGLRPYGDGAIILTDAFGNVISHPDPGVVRRQENIGHWPIVRSSTAEPTTTSYRDQDGGYFGTTQRLPGTGWVLVSVTPAKVLLLPILRSTLILLLTVSGMLFFITVRTRKVLTKRVVAPLENFTHTITQVAEGDYDAATTPNPEASAELAHAEGAFLTMARTVHEREQEILESERRFRQLVENVREVFWIRDVGGERILYASPAFEQVYGLAREAIYADPLAFLSLVHPEDIPAVREAYVQLRQAGTLFELTYRVRRPDGVEAWIHSKGFPVHNEAGQLIRLAGVSEDVTEAKRYERSLQSIVQGTSSSTGASFFLSLTQTLAEALDVPHALVTEYLDQPPTRARTLAVWQGGKHVPETEYTLAGTPAGHISHHGYCYFRDNVSQRFPDFTILSDLGITSYMGTPLVDSQGVRIGHLAVLAAAPLQDEAMARSIITIFSARAGAELERLHAERAIARSLNEKNIMLKEIHHRVKNNLQIISSLLNLQMVQITDPVVIDLFQQSRDRIRSIALVHEELYRYDDLAHINVPNYVQTLTAKLLESHNTGSLRIEADTQPIDLPINAAVPMGLILNELIINAIKHAFPDGREGVIRISFTEDAGWHHLRVADNGVGLPPDFDPEEAESLGMQLVVNLTKQLHGEFSFESQPGCQVLIRFPVESD